MVIGHDEDDVGSVVHHLTPPTPMSLALGARSAGWDQHVGCHCATPERIELHRSRLAEGGPAAVDLLLQLEGNRPHLGLFVVPVLEAAAKRRVAAAELAVSRSYFASPDTPGLP
jgi:hypothetical protein